MKQLHELRYGGEILAFSSSLSSLVNLRKDLIESKACRYSSLLEIFKYGKELYNG